MWAALHLDLLYDFFSVTDVAFWKSRRPPETIPYPQGGYWPLFWTGMLALGILHQTPKYLIMSSSEPQNIKDRWILTPKYQQYRTCSDPHLNHIHILIFCSFANLLCQNLMTPNYQVLKLETPKYLFRVANISDPKISECAKFETPKYRASIPVQKSGQYTPWDPPHTDQKYHRPYFYNHTTPPKN